jgi:ABC-type nitrate/sulfonate/bicarbonate transport system substrate-binding protein
MKDETMKEETMKEQRMPRIGRRTVLGATLALPAIAHGQGALAKLHVSVGRQPWAAGNSPITQYMIAQKLFEKRAAEFGYDLTVDWRDYPSALPMVEALVGGNLDFGMWGNTPIIRVIAARQPISALVVGEGHFRFIVCTRDGSPVHDLHALKGKTVGALLGGDPYNAFSQMLLYQLGSADPRALGITIVNTATGAQAASVPRGMDAAVATLPSFLAAVPSGTVGIVNSFGYTESYYQGDLGKGAGILIPSAKKSPFWPEGFYLHRSFWVLRDVIAEKTPKVVTAFVVAQQQAIDALMKMSPGDVSQLVKSYWKLSPADGAKVVGDELLFRRGWAWPTEGDAWALVTTSKFMVSGKMIEQPLDWAQVKGAFAKTAPLMQAAYDHLGRQPPAASFVAKDAPDLRGPPAWEMSQWQQRG